MKYILKSIGKNKFDAILTVAALILATVSLFSGNLMLFGWQLSFALSYIVVLLYKNLTEGMLDIIDRQSQGYEKHYLLGRMDERTGAPLREFNESGYLIED